MRAQAELDFAKSFWPLLLALAPLVPTVTMSRQRRRRRAAPLLKSRDPYLAGEKVKVHSPDGFELKRFYGGQMGSKPQQP